MGIGVAPSVHASVGCGGDGEFNNEYVQAESGKAMRQVLGATASARQETVTPPTAAAGPRDWEHEDSDDDGFDEHGDISPE